MDLATFSSKAISVCRTMDSRSEIRSIYLSKAPVIELEVSRERQREAKSSEAYSSRGPRLHMAT